MQSFNEILAIYADSKVVSSAIIDIKSNIAQIESSTVYSGSNVWMKANSNIYVLGGCNVGIGTNTPRHALDVVGNINIASGSLLSNGSDFVPTNISGILPIGQGGTGVSTGLSVLNAANVTGNFSNITSTGAVSGSVFNGTIGASNVSGSLPISQGGTGVSTGLTVINAANVTGNFSNITSTGAVSGSVFNGTIGASNISGSLPISQGGTGVSTGLTVLNAANITGNFPSVTATGAVTGTVFNGTVGASNVSGSILIAQGGTGVSTGLSVINAANVIGTFSNITSTGAVSGSVFNGTVGASNISGSLPIAQGGTGVSTGLMVINAANVVGNFPSVTSTGAVSGSVFNGTVGASNVSGSLTIAQGGTGVTTGLAVLNAANVIGNFSSVTSIGVVNGSLFNGSVGASNVIGLIPIAQGGTGVSTGLTVLDAAKVTGNFSSITSTGAITGTIGNFSNVTTTGTVTGSVFNGTIAASNISGIIPSGQGGTGVSTGLTVLNAANVIGNFPTITSTGAVTGSVFNGTIAASNISGIIPSGQGGTGVSTGLTVIDAANVIGNFSNITATGVVTGTVFNGTIGASNISGIIPSSQGGTGVSTGLTVLNAANVIGNFSNITATGVVTGSLFNGSVGASNVSGSLPIGQGGTGVATGLSVLNAANVTGNFSNITATGVVTGSLFNGSVGASNISGSLPIGQGGTGVATGLTVINAANVIGNFSNITATGIVNGSVFNGTIGSFSNVTSTGAVTATVFSGTIGASNISGIIPSSQGGTGVSTGLTILNAANVTGNFSNITATGVVTGSLFNGSIGASNISGSIPIDQGGTGVSTGLNVINAANVTGNFSSVTATGPVTGSVFNGSIDASNISGVLPNVQGGTGVSTGLTVLNAANVTGNFSSITATGVVTGSLFNGTVGASNIIGVVPSAQGGTGVSISLALRLQVQ
jgi:hypothetical protein